jgi:hypothetical protein
VNAEELFTRYFLPLYPPDCRAPADLARARATDANPGRNPALFGHLEEAAQRFVDNAPALFGADARAIRLDRTSASVHRLGAALTLARRDAWASAGDAGTPQNALFNAVVHGAAYVGACIVASHGGAWSVRRPLWESVVRLKSHAGEADLAVFHWWLKSLADDALAPSGDGGAEGWKGAASLADRYRAHVEVPTQRPEELPVVVPEPRAALPRLKSPSYDLLHKYLRAHLPTLRDLGSDFPSAERFAAYAFTWLDFHVLGGGRLVLMAGASAHGLHLFWLGAAGFEKSAFFACDAFPEPIVRVEQDRLVALTSDHGETRAHDMLWWGP